MFDVKQVATVALSSALADWEADQPISLTTVRAIRLAHSLLNDGLPSEAELRPFLGKDWVIWSRRRVASMADANADNDTEYSRAQILALAARVGIPERIVSDLLQPEAEVEPITPGSAEIDAALGIPERFVSDLLHRLEGDIEPIMPGSADTIADLIDLINATGNEQEEDWMTVTWWAIIRLASGNQQRIEIGADSQINARQMIEAQYGRGSIQSGPHRLDLMRAR